MSKSLKQYQMRISRLRKIIFGEVVRPNQELKISKLFARRPWEMELEKFYPPFKQFDTLLLKLRAMGLYYDEHWEFRDWVFSEREKAGKLRVKGQGKRQMHREQDEKEAMKK